MPATGAVPVPETASPEDVVWSRPVTIATTVVEARPPLVVDGVGRVHIFYIDRETAGGVVRWITTDLDGRILGGPRVLGAADLRARALAAAIDGSGIRVAWVAPAGERMRVVSMRVRDTADTTIRDAATGPVEPLAPPAEDAGPIALAPSARGAHAAWSQASGGRREIWYWHPGLVAPVSIGAGDAPGLSVGPAGPSIVWWQRAGFDTYRLVTAPLGAAAPTPPGGTASDPSEPEPLTGRLATSRLQPPAVAHDAAGRLHVVFGTEQRGFGPAVGRLSLLAVGADGSVSPRRAVAPASPFAAGAVAVPWHGGVAFAWTDLRSGRSRNPEIYVGLVTDGVLRERRLTYTLSASVLPALAPGPGAALTAAWLEVASVGRFAVQLATTARPVPQRFVLGIPELDLYRPGDAAAFAFTVLFGTLPYAALLTLATSLLTAAALAVGGPVFGNTRWWAWLTASGCRAGIAALTVALVGLAVVGGALFPFIPRLPLGAATGILALIWAWTRVRRGAPLTFGQRAALVLSVVFGVSVVLAFTWVARTLSQLAT